MAGWSIVGVTLQVCGIGLAAWALRDNLRSYGENPAVIPAVSRAIAWVRRRLSRPVQLRVHGGRVTATTTWVGIAHGEAPVGEDAPLIEQMAFMRRRMARLYDDVADVREKAAQTRKELEARISDIDVRAAGRTAHLESQRARVAAGSARQELLGLFLVVVGTVVSAFG